MSDKTIGIIIAYNAAKTLANVKAGVPIGILDKIIVADDSSTDSTLAVASHLGLEAYTHPHSGYGGNLKFGIQKALDAGANFIVMIHGDDQYDLTSIAPALEKIRKGNGLILGSRFTGSTDPVNDGMPMIKYLANRALSSVDRWILKLPLSEFHTGFRIYSKSFLEKSGFEKWSNDYLFDFQTIIAAKKLGVGVSEIPVRCIYHKNALSINFWRSAKYALQTFILLAKYLIF